MKEQAGMGSHLSLCDLLHPTQKASQEELDAMSTKIFEQQTEIDKLLFQNKSFEKRNSFLEDFRSKIISVSNQGHSPSGKSEQDVEEISFGKSPKPPALRRSLTYGPVAPGTLGERNNFDEGTSKVATTSPASESMSQEDQEAASALSEMPLAKRRKMNQVPTGNNTTFDEFLDVAGLPGRHPDYADTIKVTWQKNRCVSYYPADFVLSENPLLPCVQEGIKLLGSVAQEKLDLKKTQNTFSFPYCFEDKGCCMRFVKFAQTLGFHVQVRLFFRSGLQRPFTFEQGTEDEDESSEEEENSKDIFKGVVDPVQILDLKRGPVTLKELGDFSSYHTSSTLLNIEQLESVYQLKENKYRGNVSVCVFVPASSQTSFFSFFFRVCVCVCTSVLQM